MHNSNNRFDLHSRALLVLSERKHSLYRLVVVDRFPSSLGVALVGHRVRDEFTVEPVVGRGHSQGSVGPCSAINVLVLYTANPVPFPSPYIASKERKSTLTYFFVHKPAR